MKLSFAKSLVQSPALKASSLLFTLLCFLPFSLFAQSQNGERPLQAKASLSTTTFEPEQNVVLKIELNLPKGFRAYADQFKLKIKEPLGFQIEKFDVSPIVKFYDENTKKTKEGILDKATLIAAIEAPKDLKLGQQVLKMGLTYQACTATYCLFPIEEELELQISVGSKNQPIEPTSVSNKEEQSDFFANKMESLFSKGLMWTFIAVFIAGFLTSLTPCIFPMIPITISILGRNSHLRTHGHNFLLANLYVLGIAITYASLGVFAAATGAMFGSFMSHPVVLSIICLVFLAMSLSMFGLFEIQPPLFIRQKFSGDLHVKGYSAAFIYGIIAGVVASPCVGPILVTILTFVAKSQNLWLGFWLLFVFAIGMGQLFLIIGLSSSATKLLPKSGNWMNSVKLVFALSMLAAFYYYLSLLLPLRWWDGFFGAGLVVAGSLLGAFDPVAQAGLGKKLSKGIWQAVIFLGAAFITISILNLRPQLFANQLNYQPNQVEKSKVHWVDYSDQALQQALKDRKPVIIDFWADWCAACLELEKLTFSTSEFQSATKDIVLLKFNATDNSAALDQLKVKYGIVGLPTIIFYDAAGKWRKELTINEFLPADKFVEHLNQIRK